MPQFQKYSETRRGREDGVETGFAGLQERIRRGEHRLSSEQCLGNKVFPISVPVVVVVVVAAVASVA